MFEIMKEIKLTQGLFAQVDDWNFDDLNQWKWHAYKNRNTYYAATYINNEKVLLHRFIMNTPKGMEVDHKDHDGLNCQEYNMRNCTPKQNSQNQIQPISNSGYIGVHFRKDRNKYLAYIENGKKIYLGYFNTAIEAAVKRDEAAKKYYGEFANLNFKQL
jgi:hypothetical protein